MIIFFGTHFSIQAIAIVPFVFTCITHNFQEWNLPKRSFHYFLTSEPKYPPWASSISASHQRRTNKSRTSNCVMIPKNKQWRKCPRTLLVYFLTHFDPAASLFLLSKGARYSPTLLCFVPFFLHKMFSAQPWIRSFCISSHTQINQVSREASASPRSGVDMTSASRELVVGNRSSSSEYVPTAARDEFSWLSHHLSPIKTIRAVRLIATLASDSESKGDEETYFTSHKRSTFLRDVQA